MKVTPIEPFSNDARGSVAEYYHDRTGLHLIVFSKAGSVRGRHYHKGISISKNPEVIVLLSGTCTINWRETSHTDCQTETVIGPARIEIQPYIWHELVAVTDCSFLELNSLSEHVADTFYES